MKGGLYVRTAAAALLVLFCVTSVPHAAAAPSLITFNDIQYTSDALKEYDLVELARLVYKTEPKIFEASLRQFLNSQGKGEETDKILGLLSADRDSCTLCLTIIGVLKASDPQQVTDSLIVICENISVPLGIRGDVLCNGTLSLQMPHVYRVLDKRENNALRVCQFLNLCFPPSSTSEVRKNPAAENSSITKRKISKRSTGPTSRSIPFENSLVVVQLTDIHLEPKYEQRTNTQCGLPVCCVADYGPGYAKSYGDYRCNIPRATAEVFVQRAKRFNPDVILFSGDVPPHSVWEETPESQKECSRILVEVLNETIPGQAVYPNIGNHEGYPTNLFSVGSMKEYTSDFLNFYADLWQPLANFTDEERAHITSGGFYSKLVSDNLRLISFNTNYMYTFNWYNTDNHRLPSSISEYKAMTDFVETQLELAKNESSKVILMGHHPPGGSDYIVAGSRWYRNIVLQYADTIVLQPSGHTHYDEFRMIYDDYGEPRSVVLVAPSMSSGGTRNPSMRVFYLNRETKELLDYEQYFLDIGPVLNKKSVANADELITLLYTATEAYGMEDLSPSSWNKLLKRFETDRNLLNAHRSRSQAEANKNMGACLEMCQKNYICRQRYVNYDEYKNCTVSLGDFLESLTTREKPTRTSPPSPGVNASPPATLSGRIIPLLVAAVLLVLAMN